VENTVLQLLNDMRTVVEARCRIHGIGGGTTANAAAALLPCIGMEMVAERTRRADESKDDSIRRVFRELAQLTQYPTYATVGFAFFKLCRNGLAHGFFPNDVQLANGPKGGVMVSFWIDEGTQRSICVNEVSGPAESGHLTLVKRGDRVLLQVFAQHLYLHVKAFLEEFRHRLASDTELQTLVEQNDEHLMRLVSERASEGLAEGDFIALGI
jgi:hypothetical protein